MAKGTTNLTDKVADQVADLPPPQRHLVAKSGTNLADKMADQVADLPPGRGILWPRVELTWQTRWQIKWQIYNPVEASCGQDLN